MKARPLVFYRQAAACARAVGDVGAWASAVLGCASMQDFESELGSLPAELHEVYVRVDHDDVLRACLAGAALPRCRVYAGNPERAVPFAEQAVARRRRRRSGARPPTVLMPRWLPVGPR